MHQGIEWDRVLSAFSGNTAETQRIRNKTGQENAAVAEGTTTAALLQTMRQPGEGDEAAAMSGLGGGRAILRTSANTADDAHLDI